VRCGHVGCLPLRLVSSSAPACVHKHIERKRGLESFRFTVEYLGLGLARAHLRGARVLICHGGLHGKNGNSLVRTVVSTSGTRIRSLSAIATPDSEHWLQLRRATPDSDAGARRARHPATDTVPLFRPAGLRCRRARPASTAVRDGCPRSLPNGPTGSVLYTNTATDAAAVSYRPAGWHGATQTNVY
jgi:hypothetical protein